MLKSLVWTAASLAVLIAASAADAQQYAGHCSQCQANYGYGATLHDSCHDNSIWPKQYVGPSRRAICQAFSLQVANGWRRNNLLGKYDFAPEGEGLSEAGRLRVRWILTQAPPERRTIFVERGFDPTETAGRVEAVQTLAADFGVGPVEVQDTYMRDYGRPAQAVDAVFTGFTSNQPPPMLPSSNAPGGGG